MEIFIWFFFFFWFSKFALFAAQDDFFWALKKEKKFKVLCVFMQIFNLERNKLLGFFKMGQTDPDFVHTEIIWKLKYIAFYIFIFDQNPSLLVKFHWNVHKKHKLFKIKNKILLLCDLSFQKKIKKKPWFFHSSLLFFNLAETSNINAHE
jgi:hypothetical protein